MDIDLGLKADVFAAIGATVAEVRMVDDEYILRAGTWLTDTKSDRAHSDFGTTANYYLGAQHKITLWGHRVGFGVLWVDQENGINGTKWNFATSYEWKINTRYSIEWLHVSHGSLLGIRRDRPNDGYNFVGINYKL